MAVHAIFLKSIGFVFSVMFSTCKYTTWKSLCQALHRNMLKTNVTANLLKTVSCGQSVFRWNLGEGLYGRKFTLKRWYRRGLKEANLFGRKTVCGRWDSKDINPENIRTFPLSRFQQGRVCKTESAPPKIVLRRLKNRLQQNGKSYGAECIRAVSHAIG